MSTLQQLRCFVTVLDFGSVSSAADHLGFAQPSVSAQLQQLERSMGATLFHRVGRRIVPTEEALAMRRYAERALLAVDDAHRIVADVQEMRTGTVRFGVFNTARLFLGGETVERVLDQYPDVRVELVGRHSSNVADGVRSGFFEAGCVVLPINDSGLDVTPIVQDEMVVVSSVDDERRSITGVGLSEMELILADASSVDDDPHRRQLNSLVQEVGRTLNIKVEVEDIEVALDVASRGLAATVATRGALHLMRDRLSPALHWRPFRPALHDTFAIIKRRDSQLSRRVRMVSEIVAARLRRIQDEITELS